MIPRGTEVSQLTFLWFIFCELQKRERKKEREREREREGERERERERKKKREKGPKKFKTYRKWN